MTVINSPPGHAPYIWLYIKAHAMKKLLIPCDFSTPSLNALKFSLDVAAKISGTVHLLHVIELPALHDSVLMPVRSFEEDLLKELREDANTKFAALRKKHCKSPVKIVTEVQFGRISDCIRKYAADKSIDAIIMGSHGASGPREFFIGSNAEKIVRLSDVPVLVLKEAYKGPIKNIVFPNTLETEQQGDLIQKVKALQQFFKARLHIVWINTPVNFATDTETRKRLEKFAKRYQFRDYTLNIYNHLNPEDGIIEFTKLMDADLIALGTHGRTGLARMVHGSLTESLVNHTNQLVWSYGIKPEQV